MNWGEIQDDIFYDDLVVKTFETIKECHNCSDILNDLNYINLAITNIKLYEDCFETDQVD